MGFKNVLKNIVGFSVTVLALLAAIAGAARAPEFVGDSFNWSEQARIVAAYCSAGFVLFSVVIYASSFAVKRLMGVIFNAPLRGMDEQTADAYIQVNGSVTDRRSDMKAMMIGIACKSTVLNMLIIFIDQFIVKRVEVVANEIERESDTLEPPIEILSRQARRLTEEFAIFENCVKPSLTCIEKLPEFPDNFTSRMNLVIEKFREVEIGISKIPPVDADVEDDALVQAQQARSKRFSGLGKDLLKIREELIQIRDVLKEGKKKCQHLTRTLIRPRLLKESRQTTSVVNILIFLYFTAQGVGG